MKRYIKANKYRTEADKLEQHIALAAQRLADAINATDDSSVKNAAQGLGKFFERLDRSELIKALLTELQSMADEYEANLSIDSDYDVVVSDLIKFLKDKGYAMEPSKSGVKGYTESYIIMPADQCEFSDLNDVCNQISKYFDIKWDTPLGGSWTSHQSEMLGVRFRVGFERDYDFDPSGKEFSLMLTIY